MQALVDLKIGDFVEFVDRPKAIDESASLDGWFVVLTQPQQEIPLVWRLHELALELFTPLIRKRVKTGRVDKSGNKIMRSKPEPMFPGYGFLRCTKLDIENVRGFSAYMLDIRGKPIVLPHAAVMAVFRKQLDEHQEFLQSIGGRKSRFKPGDMVRVDESGGVYAGMVAKIDKVDKKGRIQILLGMIRHTLGADMVVVA